MSIPSEVLEIVQLFVRKAEHDFEAARRIVNGGDDCPNDTVCFHAQQCVEKYLKALLSQSGVQAPRTHDLTDLFALLPQELRGGIRADNLAWLNPFAVAVRYADDLREPSQTDAARALESARQIRSAVRLLLADTLIENS